MVDQTTQDRPEPPDVAVGPVLWGALGSLILMGSAVAGLHAVFVFNVPNRQVPSPAAFPQPQLQTDEVAQRQRIEQQQRQLLTGYAWADRSKGLVRIPIARAMDLIVARGADAYAPLLPAGPALSSPSGGAERQMTPGASVPATTAAKP
jgi:hypothetical protein